MSFSIGRIVARLSTGAGVAGLGSGAYMYQTDEGTRRSLAFWTVAAPIYAHYRYVQWKVTGLPDAEADPQYQRLHEKYAPVVEDLTVTLKGFYLKNAQTISTRDEMVPPEYMAFCKRMQDSVPTEFAPGQARALVEKGLGVPFDQVFSHWEEKPLGVASIGEVHLATLKDGRRVAVKVMMPGIEAKFRSDLTTIIRFCKIAQQQHVKPLEEIERQFLTEFDYLGEAANMRDVRASVLPVWGDRVAIPAPIMELCTKEILVMEYLPGVRLIDGVRDQFRKYALQQGRTLEDMEHEQKEKIRTGELKRVSLQENASHNRQLGWLVRGSDLLHNTPAALYNWTVGWVAQPKAYQWSEKPINLGEIIDLVNQVHAYEIFMNGVFNGDPHPGNILLCDDGKIGLIDYGQVKRISKETRCHYAELILLLEYDDREAIVKKYTEIGIKTERMDPHILWCLATFWNDRDSDDVTRGMNVQVFMDWMQSTDPLLELPQEYVMMARVSVLLRGIASAFGMSLRIAPTWAPLAEKLLAAEAPEKLAVIHKRRLELAQERAKLAKFME